MVEAMKKSESEDESDVKVNYLQLTMQISALVKENYDLKTRLMRLEEEMLALQRGDNTGFKHQNDGGWFD